MTMPQEKAKRDKWLTIRLTTEEYEQVQRLSTRTTAGSVSEYGRRVVLGKPVVMRYRNQSLDDFLADMMRLQAELNRIGTNFNQAVHRLHTLHFVPEIQHWVLTNEQDKAELFRQIERINQKITEAYKLWSQE